MPDDSSRFPHRAGRSADFGEHSACRCRGWEETELFGYQVMALPPGRQTRA